MVQEWEPGTQYNIGDVVEYQGHVLTYGSPYRARFN